MINILALTSNGKLRQIPSDYDPEAHKETNRIVWVDLVKPDADELAKFSEKYGVDIPSPSDLGDIEASARFFEDEETGAMHMRNSFFDDGDKGLSKSVNVAFILANGILFSSHDEDLPVLRLARMRAKLRPLEFRDAKDILLEIYSTDVEKTADELEDIHKETENASRMLLSNSEIGDGLAREALSLIAKSEDSIGRLKINLLDDRRALSFLLRGKILDKDQADDAKQTLQDIDSLQGHISHLFDKVNFLMDTTVGFVSINQNKIIRIFTVASVALMPPTLIASVYGMNFKNLPELSWSYGYPMSLLMMLCSAAAPILYFRKKGWLK